ncbi:MAG: MarR family winged helix-turn-helix transcriptional regulator [Beijerinckiaceae bacterium]
MTTRSLRKGPADAAPDDGRDIETRWSYRISTLASLLDKQSARRFSRHGFSLVQWRIVTRLASIGPCSMSQLLPLAAVDRALVSREVAALEQRAFVTVASDGKDKRRKIVALTAKGQHKHADILPEVLTRHALLDGCLTQRERDVFARAIEKMKTCILEDIEREESQT